MSRIFLDADIVKGQTGASKSKTKFIPILMHEMRGMVPKPVLVCARAYGTRSVLPSTRNRDILV